jgi:hypothetical protein
MIIWSRIRLTSTVLGGKQGGVLQMRTRWLISSTHSLTRSCPKHAHKPLQQKECFWKMKTKIWKYEYKNWLYLSIASENERVCFCVWIFGCFWKVRDKIGHKNIHSFIATITTWLRIQPFNIRSALSLCFFCSYLWYATILVFCWNEMKGVRIKEQSVTRKTWIIVHNKILRD